MFPAKKIWINFLALKFGGNVPDKFLTIRVDLQLQFDVGKVKVGY